MLLCCPSPTSKPSVWCQAGGRYLRCLFVAFVPQHVFRMDTISTSCFHRWESKKIFCDCDTPVAEMFSGQGFVVRLEVVVSILIMAAVFLNES